MKMYLIYAVASVYGKNGSLKNFPEHIGEIGVPEGVDLIDALREVYIGLTANKTLFFPNSETHYCGDMDTRYFAQERGGKKRTNFIVRTFKI